MVAAFRKLAWSIATDYQGNGVPLEDLAQEAMIGLVIAARRFDLGRGTRFSSFAWAWCRKMVCRCLKNEAMLIRIPQRVWDQRRLAEYRVELTSYPAELVADGRLEAQGDRVRLRERRQARADRLLAKISRRDRDVLRLGARVPRRDDAEPSAESARDRGGRCSLPTARPA